MSPRKPPAGRSTRGVAPPLFGTVKIRVRHANCGRWSAGDRLGTPDHRGEWTWL